MFMALDSDPMFNVALDSDPMFMALDSDPMFNVALDSDPMFMERFPLNAE